VLLDAFPDDAVLGEEGGEVGASDRLWVVDPLDGTVNYAHGFPVYCVSIALTVRGERVVGVVLDTARGELFTATKGGGTRLDGQLVTASSRERLDEAMLATGFAYESRWMPESVQLFGKMLHACRAIRRPGAAALDLAYLAAGRIDGFWERCLKPWDTAAGSLLVEEAGGRVSGESEAEWVMGDPLIVASSPGFHRELVDALTE